MAKREHVPTIIDTPEALLTAKIAAMKEAQKIFRAAFTQEQVDKIFKAPLLLLTKVASLARAKMLLKKQEWYCRRDKVIKNHYAVEYVYNAYKNTELRCD